MDMCFWQPWIANEEGIELITATARNHHLTESEANSPREPPLVGIDVVMGIQQFSFENTPIKASHFHNKIHAWGASYFHKKIGRNQDCLLSIRQIAIEQVVFIREFRSQQLILRSCFQSKMRAEIDLCQKSGIDSVTAFPDKT